MVVAQDRNGAGAANLEFCFSVPPTLCALCGSDKKQYLGAIAINYRSPVDDEHDDYDGDDDLDEECTDDDDGDGGDKDLGAIAIRAPLSFPNSSSYYVGGVKPILPSTCFSPADKRSKWFFRGKTCAP